MSIVFVRAERGSFSECLRLCFRQRMWFVALSAGGKACFAARQRLMAFAIRLRGCRCRAGKAGNLGAARGLLCQTAPPLRFAGPPQGGSRQHDADKRSAAALAVLPGSMAWLTCCCLLRLQGPWGKAAKVFLRILSAPLAEGAMAYLSDCASGRGCLHRSGAVAAGDAGRLPCLSGTGGERFSPGLDRSARGTGKDEYLRKAKAGRTGPAARAGGPKAPLRVISRADSVGR